MRSRSGRTRKAWWGQGPAHHLRVGFDLEVLEPRLLMTASPARSWGMSSPEVPALVSVPSPWDHSATSWTGPSPGPGGDTGGGVSVGGGLVSTRPWIFQTLSPPTDDSYVIVGETNWFHGTGPTAQQIPTVPYAGVIGAIKLGDAVDLYRVILGPETLALRLASTLKASPNSPPIQLWVFDALGHVLASVSSASGSLGLSIDGQKLGLQPGSPVLIGVAPSEIRGPDAPVGYQLWFLRDSGSAASPADGEPSSSGFETIPAVNSTDIAGGLTAVTALASPMAVSAGSAVAGSGAVLVAVAQLPTLSAAPSGGVLANGAPISAVAPRTESDEGPQEAQEVAAQSEPSAEANDQIAALEGGAASPLIARRGPGGFPVLAAATIGDWRAERDEVISELSLVQVSDRSVGACSASSLGPLAALDPALSLGIRDHVADRTAAGLAGRSNAALAPVGLESAFAFTVYALSVDRTSLQDLFETRTPPDGDLPGAGKRKNLARRLLRRIFG